MSRRKGSETFAAAPDAVAGSGVAALTYLVSTVDPTLGLAVAVVGAGAVPFAPLVTNAIRLRWQQGNKVTVAAIDESGESIDV
jgi:hypothetical protein